MPYIQHTAVMESGPRGWTESYVRFQSSNNLQAALDDMIPFWQKRALMLGASAFIKARSCSSVSTRGDSRLVYDHMPGDQTEPVNDLETSLNILMQDSDALKRKTTYFRGIWDSIIGSNDFNDDNTKFVTLFNQWRAEAIARAVGWWGIASEVSSFITNYTLTPSNQVNFTLQTPVLPWAGATYKASVRLSNIAPRSVLNREIVVWVTSANTMITVAPIAAAAYQGTGFVHYATFAFIRGDLINVQRLGRRPAGAPLLQPVGRGRNRART